jgi:hypothetical protein
MPKKYKIRIGRYANQLYLKHLEFLAQVSLDAAGTMDSAFGKLINMIRVNPFFFPYADELDVPNIPDKTYRKGQFYRRYKALFKIEDDQVFIDAIIDARMENKDIFLTTAGE